MAMLMGLDSVLLPTHPQRLLLKVDKQRTDSSVVKTLAKHTSGLLGSRYVPHNALTPMADLLVCT